MLKKQFIDLKSKNISYEQNNQTIKLLSFKKSNMSLEVSIFENGEYIKNSTIVFAHLPKSIKARIKPL
ncbi:MAG: malate dehydrogenase [Halarcobacter sp.]